jgi:hypothetical protein
MSSTVTINTLGLSGAAWDHTGVKQTMETANKQRIILVPQIRTRIYT